MPGFSRRPPFAVLGLLFLCAALAGCGKSMTTSTASNTSASAPLPTPGAVSVATSNTTRLGGSDPVLDAAAVARAVYPGLTASSRPQAVVLVDERDWPAALAASALASAPLRAPLLYGEGGALPEASVQALRAMHPVGAPALAGAQVIQVGSLAGVPDGLRTRSVLEPASSSAAPGAGPASVAAAIEQLLATARGGAPHQVIVVASDGPPALQMPAAGLSAESGTPILFVTGDTVPAATAAVLKSLRRPAIYVVGASAVHKRALAELANFGAVTQIAATGASAGGTSGGAATSSTGATGAAAEGQIAVENAIAVARFTDGSFGWGVKEPGHGLVFANLARPFDAPASALLSASGDYGPLLLLDAPYPLPPTLAQYLSDIQPAYGHSPQYEPVHGAYNHGWLIGDQAAISAVTQAEIDSLLEISPSKGTPEEPAEASAE